MIIVRAPFRLPIGGGGTDLPSYYSEHEGSLITAAINKYMYISVNTPACINHISVKYSKTETVTDISEIKHEIVREVLSYLDFRGSVEISSMADAPAGTGLGSSSSYTVGLLKAMNTLLHRNLSKEEVAKEACHIEMERIGGALGKQDQYASALGGIFGMNISKEGDVEIVDLHLDRDLITELQYRFVMFYTGMKRSADLILQDQATKIKQDESAALRAMHEIKSIGVDIGSALKKGDIDTVGKLMHQHWNVKKRISTKMSSNTIDRWYEVAIKNGAIGGKIMGAGGGGFFVFCVAEGKRRSLIKAMLDAGLNYTDFAFDFEGAKVLADI